jgi:hypothetical protein
MRVLVIATTSGIHEVEGTPGVVAVVDDYTALDPVTLLQAPSR